MTSQQKEDSAADPSPSFEAHPEHAAAVNQAIHAIRELAKADPEFGEQLRLTASTDDVRKLLETKGIQITDEALWRHRGKILEGMDLTWRG
jgi:hypothetical protein